MMVRWIGRRRWLTVALAMAVVCPAPARAEGEARANAVIAQLRLARAMLCARCVDDIERSGVNHPARRSLMGAGKLVAVRDMIEATPDLPGAVPALRQVLFGIEVLGYQDEEDATAAIDAAIRAIRAESRVAAGGPPDPRALMGQLRLARRQLCPRCLEDPEQVRRRARTEQELAVAAAMLDAAPALRGAARARRQVEAARQAIAARGDLAAERAIMAALAAVRPRPS